MTKTDITVKENLTKARKKAHLTMIKNGHFKRMIAKRWAKKGKKARKS